MSLYTEDTIQIKGSMEEVWNALTNPSITPNYMYGCAVESSWKKDDKVLWRNEDDQQVYVTGFVLEVDAPRKLIYTVFNPFASYPDILENHLSVEYKLEHEGKETILTVIQGDFDAVAEGASRYKDATSNEGFLGIMKQIKELVER